jgi:hypothetical protein
MILPTKHKDKSLFITNFYFYWMNFKKKSIGYNVIEETF